MGLLECPNSLAAGFPEGMIQEGVSSPQAFMAQSQVSCLALLSYSGHWK